MLRRLPQIVAGKDQAPNTVLITGASSGIGRELALLFARDGYRLVLVSRSQQALTALADTLQNKHGVCVNVIAMDLACAEAAASLLQELQQRQLHIDILVNNAGFGVYGEFHRADRAVQLEMIQLNVTTLTDLTKLLLPDMVSKRSGKILNVASTAAFQPGPLMAVYYATKAYVLSFSEALANELHGSGVTVTVLCPGPTPTGFQRRAGVQSSRVFSGHMVDAATVARIGYEGLMRGRLLVIPGVRNRLLACLVRVVPRQTVTRIVRSIQENRQPV